MPSLSGSRESTFDNPGLCWASASPCSALDWRLDVESEDDLDRREEIQSVILPIRHLIGESCIHPACIPGDTTREGGGRREDCPGHAPEAFEGRWKFRKCSARAKLIFYEAINLLFNFLSSPTKHSHRTCLLNIKAIV